MTTQKLRDDNNKTELVEIVSRRAVLEGTNEVADGLNFFKHVTPPVHPHHGVYSPSICIIAQGAKEVQMGEHLFRYDPSQFLLTSFDVPVSTRIVEARPDKPFLGLKMDLEPTLIASVSVEAGVSPGKNDCVKSIDVGRLEGELLDAFVRLFRLLDCPSDYRVVSPLVIREIIYRLLMSEHGPRLRQMAAYNGHTNRIGKAVQTLRTRFNEALSIEDLARDLGMSVSSFHQHFKTATSMSPLQFQKLLRLQEARRLLLSEDVDASSAALRVGYDDASQFTREYKRLFGDPPMRDVARFKQLSAAGKS